MNQILSIGFICLIPLLCLAQKEQIVTGIFTFSAPSSMSVDEAKRIALEKAKLKAIEDVFGTIVANSSSAMVHISEGETSTQFSSYGNTSVKGEWIQNIGEPTYETSFEDHCVVVKCTVKGKIRELLQEKIDFEALTLRNSPNKKYSSTQFYDGDDLYLYFRSPVSGFLNVFLVSQEDNQAFCLLPYKKSDGKSVKIDGDKEYIFFSPATAEKGESNIIDEYTLSASLANEINDIIIIFSPDNFYKVGLKTEKELTVPKYLSINKFNDWLSRLKNSSKEISIKPITITISKQ